jgi:DNA primase
MSTVTQQLKELVYPSLNAVEAGLVDHLHPKGSSGHRAYSLDCPACGESDRAFYYPGSAYINCNRKNQCGATTSIWDAIAVNHSSNKEIVDALYAAAGIPQLPTRSTEFSKQDFIKKKSHENLLACPQAMDYLQGRGWSLEEIKAAPIGMMPKKEESNPWENRIIGWWKQPDGTDKIWGRTFVDAHPKYKYSINSSRDIPYLADHNLNRSAQNVLVVEGVLDALRLVVNNIPAIAIGSCHPSQAQVRYMASRPSCYIFWIDNDVAGRRAALDIWKSFAALDIDIGVMQAHPEDGKDPDEFITRQGKAAVANLLESAQNGMAFFVDAVLACYDPADYLPTRRLLDKVRSLIAPQQDVRLLQALDGKQIPYSTPEQRQAAWSRYIDQRS